MEGPVDLRLDAYLNLFLAGPTSSGKTFLTCQLIINRDSLYKVPTDGCIYVYKHYQPCFDEIKAKDDQVQFTNSIQELQELISVEHNHFIVVFDDMILQSLYEDIKFITEWFLISNHHYKCSTIFQSQLLFPRNLKCLALNSAYFGLFKSNNQSQIQTFLRQINPARWRTLLSIYNECVEGVDFGIFVLNLHSREKSSLRFRNFLLPQAGGKVFVLK